MGKNEQLITRAIEILNSGKSLFVLSGAGISAESGIPTFRGADGLWKNYSATDLATPEAFERNPELVWEWYHWRQSIIVKAEPNPAHYAIVELEKKFDAFLLLTQNVDNLHQRAGSIKVLELHGNIFRARCTICCKVVEDEGSKSSTVGHCEERSDETISRHRKKKDEIATPLDKRLDRARRSLGARNDNPMFRAVPKEQSYELPRCDCGGPLRPDVVWFGEQIPQDIWLTSLEFLTSADVAIICGTSGVVWPAAAIPGIAKRCGIKTVEINLGPTPVSSIVDVSIFGKAGEILPQIVQALNK